MAGRSPLPPNYRRSSHSLPQYAVVPGHEESARGSGFCAACFRSVEFNPRYLHHMAMSRFGRKKGTVLLLCAFSFFAIIVFLLLTGFGAQKRWRIPFVDPPTLVYRKEDLQRIWTWEVESGHYPSRKAIPLELGLNRNIPSNPAVPPRKLNDVQTPSVHGTGPNRIYLEIQSDNLTIAFPPRPLPGSIADMDIVMEHCDFSTGKLVRDCLEVLRLGAGLDNGNRLRREGLDERKYIYVEKSKTSSDRLSNSSSPILQPDGVSLEDDRLPKKMDAELETPPIKLLPIVAPQSYADLPTTCDPDYPRIFHMFWTGPFTDKPYMAILSFLYTQRTGLHLEKYPGDGPCRSQFWMWINPGPAASVPNPNAMNDMLAELRSNPWASPFLHERFREVLHFKLWNTTEQLDSVPEIKDEWRRFHTLFNSGGRIIDVPHESELDEDQSADDMLHRAGSKSSSSYDRLSVILSDMARFLLTHRFGGIYLDADTILLRDWEELWGWRGAFAYRWSRLPRYNTAVLHMNKGSALGTFLFRTALKHELDFHPMTVSRYVQDAYLDGLLLQLPDALFDSAWLNTEHYQRDRPPQPYFTAFEDFFDTPPLSSAAPQASGFDGFFKGAFSYHYHNFWWKPFDSARNWPELGPRFSAGEEMARKAAGNAHVTDPQDFDWSAVLKRTFESFIRGERPNMYGEILCWS